MTKEITTIKRELRLKEWSRQVEDCCSSRLTVQKWCKENGISSKTYHYRLRNVREACIENQLVELYSVQNK